MGQGVRGLVGAGLAVIALWVGQAIVQAQEATVEAAVPPVIQFNGVLRDSSGQALEGVQGVTFALYSDQEGGAPLWIESQNVAADAEGHFAALLGSATPGGLPVELFSSGASRWLGVQPIQSRDSDGAVLPEQPRILLVSVPYALKAADAETVGGLPPSAFVLAADAVTERVKDSGGLVAVSDGVITAQVNSGSAGFIGKFFNTTDLDNSALFQSVNNIGLGTTTPESVLHVQGASTDGVTITNGLNSGLAFLRFKRADGGIAGEIQSLLGTQAMVFKATGAERMRIAPSGYVGIGTTAPIAQLHVSSPGSTRMMFQGNAGTNGVVGLDMDSTARRWTLGAQGTNENGAFILYDFTAGQRRMTVDSTGQFGIGTISPTAKLDVVGMVKATAFDGDGSALTGIASTGGVNTFIGTQTITGGNLALPDTVDASTGVLTLGGNRFLHNYLTDNTFVGMNAGNFTMGSGGFGYGTNNTAVGTSALLSNGDGWANTAIGAYALNHNFDGPFNTAVGNNSLFNNTNAANNTAVGYNALFANVSGISNTAVGSEALDANVDGGSNTALGYTALTANTSGNGNTATGSDSLSHNISGNSNTATGHSSLANNTIGFANTASGDYAMYINTEGSNNTASGSSALNFNTTGSNNTAVGVAAGLSSVNDNGNTTGSNNTFIGYQSGPGVNGTTTPLTNATAIGANAVVSQDNTVVLGSINGVNGATSDVNVGIGTATPTTPLDVVGAAKVSGNLTVDTNSLFVDAASNRVGIGTVSPGERLSIADNGSAIELGAGVGGKETNAGKIGYQKFGSFDSLDIVGAGTMNGNRKITFWSEGGATFTGGITVTGTVCSSNIACVSSRRFKTNITPLEGALDKVEQLQGVSFDWNKPGYFRDGQHDIGVIAEEVGKVVPEVVVYEENGVDARTIDYARLTAVLIEAVKEQQGQIRQLQAEVENLKAGRGVEVSRARSGE